jgi:hypothetical protein
LPFLTQKSFNKKKKLFRECFPATPELFFNARKGSIFHLPQREAMRLEWSLCPYEISKFVAPCPYTIEPDIIEHIHRTDQVPVAYLETHTDDPGRAIKPCTVGIAKSDRHERAMV